MKLSLASISFLNIIFTALFFSITIGYFSFVELKQELMLKLETTKERYFEQSKEEIKTEVNRISQRIEEDIAYEYRIVQDELSEKISNAGQIITAYQKENPSFSLTQTITQLVPIFNQISWYSKTGYYYIVHEDGRILYHPNKAFIGQKAFANLSKKPALEKLLTEAKETGSAFGKYTWQKPTTKKEAQKFVYIKRLQEQPIFIAAGIYVDELDAKLKEKILRSLEKERFGQNAYGYFWVHNLEYKMILHPYDDSFYNRDLKNLQDANGKYFMQEMNEKIASKGEGYVDYSIHFVNKNALEKKISYIKKLPTWNWVIGAGFYYKDLDEFIAQEEAEINLILQRDFQQIVLILALLFVIATLVALYVAKKINALERAQGKHLGMLEQYKEILDISSIVSKTDRGGRLLYVNENFEKVTGFSKEEVLGKSHNIIRHKSTPKSTFKELWETIQAGNVWQGIIKNQAKNSKKSYYNSTTIMPLKDEEGNIIEFISAGKDITELVENRDKLESIYLTDTLTSLGSRVKLLNDIGNHKKGSLALIDIDRFTQVNDLYGQNVGDEIIREVGGTIFNYCNKNLINVYRLHADVFALYSNVLHEDEFVKYVQKCVNFLSQREFHRSFAKVNLHFTTGISYGDCELLACADIAINGAKKDEIALKIYNPDDPIVKEFEENIEWMKKLNLALEEDRIIAHFQPIYSYEEQKVSKYEALVRMLDEKGDLVFPGKFIDIAKRTKLYPQLTAKVIEKTVRYFQDKPYEFSINITLEDLLNEDTMQYFYAIVKKYKMFDRLVIEIVESEELTSFEQVIDILAKFKKQGAKIAIDDFGVGYSNYNYLIRLNVDIIKIDGAITEKITTDQTTQELIRSIVSFAKKSGIKTVAEFVSSEEINTAIKELDIDFAQGFYYGRATDKIN